MSVAFFSLGIAVSLHISTSSVTTLKSVSTIDYHKSKLTPITYVLSVIVSRALSLSKYDSPKET